MINGLGFELHRLVWTIEMKANALLQPYGLTYTQFRILRTIATKGPIAGKDLASALLVSPSSMSKSVSRLTAAGYVEDTQPAGVGNIQRLELTDEGRDILEPLAEALDDTLEDVCRVVGLDPATIGASMASMVKEIRRRG